MTTPLSKDRLHSAGQAAAKRLRRTFQQDRALRVAIAVPLGRPRSHPGFRDRLDVDLDHDRPHMALGGFTPKQRLAMAA
jgi:hypothetical protein